VTFEYVVGQLNKFDLAYLHIMDGLAFGFHGKDKQFRLIDARKLFDGTIIGNCGYNKDTAEGAIGTGAVDMIAFGRPYLSNPGLYLFIYSQISYTTLYNAGPILRTDLVERFENNWPLAETLPYPLWYMPPYDDPSLGYSDQPAYAGPDGSAGSK
jgi:N-ethylmaleimide reductase